MAYSIEFARFASLGPPALVMCASTANFGEKPNGEAAVLMPGANGRYLYRRIAWDGDAFTADPHLLLRLAQLQAEVELRSLLHGADALQPVRFEAVSDNMLILWRVLGHYEAIATICERVISIELHEALKPFRFGKTANLFPME